MKIKENNTDKAEQERKTGLPKWAWLAIGVIGVLLISAGALLAINALAEKYVWDNYSVTVSQLYYDGTVKKTQTLIGEPVTLEEPEAIANRLFLGWEKENGELLKPTTVTASVTETYTAKYAYTLDTVNHRAYIFPRQDGLFHPDENLTRGDAALMLSALLTDKPKPSGGYFDVDSEDDCYEATACLKALGICPGDRFSPEADITLAELLELLSFFYLPAENSYTFADLEPEDYYYSFFAGAAERGWIDSGAGVRAQPYSTVTRSDAVLFMNKILGRKADSRIDEQYTGGLIELAPGDELYTDMLEAVITHEYRLEGSTEVWASAENNFSIEPGPFFSGRDFYYVKPDGHIARNESIGVFSFGPDGKYTSGDPELDEMVDEVIDLYYTPDIDREELLRALFDHTVRSFKYLRIKYYNVGDNSYEVEAAKAMLSGGKGCCYHYAATFCVLARAIGYEAVVYSGAVGINMDRHGWCEIIIDEVPYICDAELMMKDRTLDMYMKTYQQLSRWNYYRRVSNQ